MYCHNVNRKTKSTIPSNCEAPSSQVYVDPKSLKASTSKSQETEVKMKVKDHGVGEYSMSCALCIGKFHLSPLTYGKPHMNETTKEGVLFDKIEEQDNSECQGIGYDSPNIVATNPKCKSPLEVKVALDINSPESGSNEESIEYITNIFENSCSLTISSTPLLDLDQQ